VDRLAADLPKTPEVPEALLLKARLLESGPDPKSAEPAYLRLAHGYPESDEGLRAAWRLGWLSWLRAEYAEAAERWGRILAIRTASQGYRDASMYWIGRTLEQRGDAEGAARQYAHVVAEAPRSYYGVLAARRAPSRTRRATPPRPSSRLRCRSTRARRSKPTRHTRASRRSAPSGSAISPTRKWTRPCGARRAISAGSTRSRPPMRRTRDTSSRFAS
jgi:hypothetical protein